MSEELAKPLSIDTEAASGDAKANGFHKFKSSLEADLDDIGNINLEDEEVDYVEIGTDPPKTVFNPTRPPRPRSAGPGGPLLSPLAPSEGSAVEGHSPARRQRQRTCSTSATVSTEREPIIRTTRRTIYTQGRPPWYDFQGQLKEPFVIGICGGSASGKTTVANKIIKELGVPWVTLLSMDSFYKVLDEREHELAERNEHNFDHPDAFDFGLLKKTLQRLKEGKKVRF